MKKLAPMLVRLVRGLYHGLLLLQRPWTGPNWDVLVDRPFAVRRAGESIEFDLPLYCHCGRGQVHRNVYTIRYNEFTKDGTEFAFTCKGCHRTHWLIFHKTTLLTGHTEVFVHPSEAKI